MILGRLFGVAPGEGARVGWVAFQSQAATRTTPPGQPATICATARMNSTPCPITHKGSSANPIGASRPATTANGITTKAIAGIANRLATTPKSGAC